MIAKSRTLATAYQNNFDVCAIIMDASYQGTQYLLSLQVGFRVRRAGRNGRLRNVGFPEPCPALIWKKDGIYHTAQMHRVQP